MSEAWSLVAQAREMMGEEELERQLQARLEKQRQSFWERLAKTLDDTWKPAIFSSTILFGLTFLISIFITDAMNLGTLHAASLLVILFFLPVPLLFFWQILTPQFQRDIETGEILTDFIKGEFGKRGLEFRAGCLQEVLAPFSFLNIFQHPGPGVTNLASGNYRGYELHLLGFQGRGLVAVLLKLERNFPELRVWSRGDSEFSLTASSEEKDVELDNLVFSRAFRVKCQDQKFAYGILSPMVMEWLVGQGKVWLEIEHQTLFMGLFQSLDLKHLDIQLDTFISFRELLPDHLFEERCEGTRKGL